MIDVVTSDRIISSASPTRFSAIVDLTEVESHGRAVSGRKRISGFFLAIEGENS
jgi:hypothetical protein